MKQLKLDVYFELLKKDYKNSSELIFSLVSNI